MLKRLLALILSLSMMFSYPMPEAKAADMTRFRLPVIRTNDDYSVTFNVLSDGENIYIADKDLASLAYLEESSEDTEVENAFSIQSVKEKSESCITFEDQDYFDLLKVFEYLHIKSNVVGSDLLVNVPQYTVLDFINDDYNDAFANFVTPYDLLKENETLVSSGLLESLDVILNNFDQNLITPFLGNSALEQEQLTNALSTLNEPDSLYYDPEVIAPLNTMLDERNLNYSHLGTVNFFKHMGFTKTIIEESKTVTDITSIIDPKSTETAKWLALIGVDADMLLTAAQIADNLPELSLKIDPVSRLHFIYELYTRAQKWKEDCASDMDLLRNLPVDLYAPGSSDLAVVNAIKSAADTCYNEKRYPELFSDIDTWDENEFILDVELLQSVLGKIYNSPNIFPPLAALNIYAAENYASDQNSPDKSMMPVITALLSYTSDAAHNHAINEYNLFNSTGDFEHLKNFRESMETALKCNLRTLSFIYTAMSDGAWETSEAGINTKDKLSKTLAYLVLLQETVKDDFVFEEYAIDYKPEDLTAVLKEPIDYEALYAPIIQEYKDAVDNDMYEKANGLRENAPNVNVELGSYSQLDFSLNYAYIDLNEDELPELLIAKEVQQTDMTSNLDKIGYLIFDMYTCVNGTAERIFDIYSMGNRMIYHICKDNLIRCYSAGGMNASGIYFYQLQPNSNTVEEVMKYKYDNLEYPPYTKTTSEGTVEINSDIFRSEGLSQDLLKTDIEWITLASHSVSETKSDTEQTKDDTDTEEPLYHDPSEYPYTDEEAIAMLEAHFDNLENVSGQHCAMITSGNGDERLVNIYHLPPDMKDQFGSPYYGPNMESSVHGVKINMYTGEVSPFDDSPEWYLW